MKKLKLDLHALRVDSFELLPERDGRGTVHAHGPGCSTLCAYLTQESCDSGDCPPPVTQASCPPAQTQGCPPPCSALCLYLTEASCTG